MKSLYLRFPLLLGVCLSTACATTSSNIQTATAPPTAQAERAEPAGGGAAGPHCAGTIDPAPTGAAAVDDAALLQEATGDDGKGKLCTGRVYAATVAIKVYRVWESAKSYSELGRWWSLSRPTGPTAAYREQNAICPEWSALDTVSVCEIKPGTHFVIGPGQSAQCAGGVSYGRSPINQVYIPNDTRAGKVLVDKCERLGVFP